MDGLAINIILFYLKKICFCKLLYNLEKYNLLYQDESKSVCIDNVAILNVAVLLVCITLHNTVCSLQMSGLI